MADPTPSKFRYIVFNFEWEEVKGTNDGDLARKLANNPDFVIADLHDNTRMIPDEADGTDAVGDTIYEIKTS